MKGLAFTNTNHKQNAKGLNTAYGTNKKLYIKDKTMFIAGTSNLQDAWDDLKIPLHLTRFSQRYQDADNLLNKNPQVKHLVSHSLGGAVGLELAERHPEMPLDNTTYGAPLLQLGGQKYKRFRHPMDPISMMDGGAHTVGDGSLNLLKNHSYLNFK